LVSTYVSYLSVARNLGASLSSVASQATVARDSSYYKENIGKVTTVDEFMGDYKLYSYAMKAYGLEDMTYAKAFMKKVLESDLSDSSSFANSLSDGRYAEFAAAFNFPARRRQPSRMRSGTACSTPMRNLSTPRLTISQTRRIISKRISRRSPRSTISCRARS
jgi:hypothetical protein